MEKRVSEDSYFLTRSYAASARLNLQHYIWTDIFDGKLLHPSIPVHDSSLRVADVATGTRIWLLDFARKHQNASRLDISLFQVPFKAWLPANVTFREYNVFDASPRILSDSTILFTCAMQWGNSILPVRKLPMRSHTHP